MYNVMLSKRLYYLKVQLKAWLQNKPCLSKKVLFICNMFFFWWGWGEKMTVACRTNHSYLKELFPFIRIIQESRILSYQLLFLFLYLFRVQEKGFCIGNLSQYVHSYVTELFLFICNVQSLRSLGCYLMSSFSFSFQGLGCKGFFIV